LVGFKERLQRLEFEIEQPVMTKCRADACQQIIGEEPTASPNLFDRRSEHPNSEHVEEDVGKPTVHELIGDELKKTKIGATPVMKTENTRQIDSLVTEYDRSEEQKAIDD